MADTPQPTEKRLPMTDEERRRRYDELRKRSALSRIYARHRDPDMYVRWARDDKHDIALHKHLGFEMVREPNPKAPESRRIVETVVPMSEDGMYRTGDVILMQIPRVDYEFYAEENAKESRRMLNAGKEGFKHNAKLHGIPVFERDSSGNIVR